MSAMTSQITGVSIACLAVCAGADQRKHKSSASLAFLVMVIIWLDFVRNFNFGKFSLNISDVFFQGQTLFWPYLSNGWSDWWEILLIKVFASDWSPMPMCQNVTNTSCCSGGITKMEPRGRSLLWVPDLKMSCRNSKKLTEYQWCNQSSGRTIIVPFCAARNNNDLTREMSIIKIYTRLFA